MEDRVWRQPNLRFIGVRWYLAQNNELYLVAGDTAVAIVAPTDDGVTWHVIRCPAAQGLERTTYPSKSDAQLAVEKALNIMRAVD